MQRISLDLDDATLARARAAAAGRGIDLDRLVERFLDTVGDDVTPVLMPRGADPAIVFLARHGGRDNVERYLGRASWDAYERPVPAHLFGCARATPGLVIDVGAYNGFYSLLAASVGPDARVIAFEAVPAVADLLQQNVAANGLGGRITVERLAVSDRDGVRDLFLPMTERGVVETSASLDRWFRRRHAAVTPVPSIAIDTYCAREAVAGQAVTLIKVAAEGHEAEILKGAVETARRWRPVFFVDVLETADNAAMSAWIARHDYVDVAMRPDELAARATVNYDPKGWTHALVPPEKLLAFFAAGAAFA